MQKFLEQMNRHPLERAFACFVSFFIFSLFFNSNALAKVSIRPNHLLSIDTLEHVYDFSLLHGIHHTAIQPLSSTYSSPSEYPLINGIHRPYPNQIQVSFKSHGESYRLHLHIMETLYEPHSDFIVYESDGSVTKSPHMLTTYRWSDQDDWAIFTIHDDANVTGLVHMDGVTTQIHPTHWVARDLDDDESVERLLSSPHTHVSFRQHDLKGVEDTHLCGAARPPSQSDDHNDDDQISTTSSTSSSHSILPSSTTRHNMSVRLSSMSNARKLLSLTRWTNCFPASSTGYYQISTGVVIDAGLYIQFGSTSAVRAYMSQVFASSNSVYMAQLGVFLSITTTNVYTSAGNLAFNRAPPAPYGTCGGYSINSQLNDFTNWRKSSNPFNNGIWHLMTACFPPPGMVGLSWVGTLCNSNYGTSVSSYSYLTWITDAHEIGHSFGAQHTFQNGQGTTGGIMDYCDGKLPCYSGQYQFNTQYSQSEICNGISSTLRTSGFSPYCWSPYTPSLCGNGILDAGEQCDDTSSCCSNCRFVGGAVCSTSTSGSCCTAQCQFAPTTTSCGSNSYCANGQCVPSTCTNGGMSFCGVKPSNTCRQQCSSSRLGCSDSFTSPNLNIANGVVCVNGGKCMNGVCSSQPQPVTPPPTTPPPTTQPPRYTYSWSTSSYSACSCQGSQTATVTCMRNDGVAVTSTFCSASSMPSTSKQCSPPLSCYAWRASSWGACSATVCNTGTQSRVVDCINTATQQVVGSVLCSSAGASPSTSQICTSTTPCLPTWSYGSWSSCSATCGSGTMTRLASCVSGSTALDNSKCASISNLNAAPSTSKHIGCYIDKPTSHTLTFVPSGVSMTPGLCAQIASQNNMQYYALQNGADCYIGNTGYDKYGTSSGCTTTCKADKTLSCGGTNAIDVYAIVSTAAPPPAGGLHSIQQCNSGTCAPVYTWSTGPYSACSASCGGGTQTRTVICLANGSPVASSLCNAALGPVSSSQACNTAPCPVYTWQSGPYGGCSQSCGGGTMTRAIMCKSDIQGVVDNSYCVAHSTNSMPATVSSCNTQSCITYAWTTGTWGACSASCGGGTSSRSVTCQDSNGKSVSDSYCTLSKPATTEACGQQGCVGVNGTAFEWHTGDWSSCTRVCGGGVQSREIKCVYFGTSTQVDASNCSTITPPSSSRWCNTRACPHGGFSATDPVWFMGNWTECSVSCGGGGVRQRVVECRDPTGKRADPALCSGISQPDAVDDTCGDRTCPSYWWMSEFSVCNALCGAGTHTRMVECRSSKDDSILDDSKCSGSKPSVVSACSVNPCPTWSPSSWSNCSTSCGPGVQVRDITCTSYDGVILTASACYASPPVATTQPCQLVPLPCDTSNTDSTPSLSWKVIDTWSTCSSECGSGNQTRTVMCVSSTPTGDILLPDSSCSSIVSSRPSSIQPCKEPVDQCKGTSMVESNGVCVESTGQCQCRTGFAGSDCSISLALSNAVIDTGSFPAGLPIGELVLITWSTSGSGNLSFVSLLLLRYNGEHTGWPYGQYIDTLVPNTGSYLWRVGQNLPDLEWSPGYVVRIYSSENVFTDTPSFSISNPCAYKSCGMHGECNNGICVCNHNFTGPTCSVGPCERAGCNRDHSTCDNNRIVSSLTPVDSICTCKDGWSGVMCNTPPSCTPVCKNGADLTQAVISLNLNTLIPQVETCGICSCMNAWVGDKCDTCSLACENGGVPDASCSKCICKPDSGYWGSTCSCPYYTVTLQLLMDPLLNQSWVNDELAIARFKRALGTDIAIAAAQIAGIDYVITVDAISKISTSKMLVEVRLSQECHSLSTGSTTQVNDGNNVDILGVNIQIESRLVVGLARSLVAISTTPIQSLYRAWVSLLPAFENTDSPLYHGAVTSSLDKTYNVMVTDPTGVTAPPSPALPKDPYNKNGEINNNDVNQHPAGSSSNAIKLDTGTTAGVVVGAVVVSIVIAVTVFVLYRKRRIAAAAAAAGKGGSKDSDSQKASKSESRGILGFLGRSRPLPISAYRDPEVAIAEVFSPGQSGRELPTSPGVLSPSLTADGGGGAGAGGAGAGAGAEAMGGGGGFSPEPVPVAADALHGRTGHAFMPEHAPTGASFSSVGGAMSPSPEPESPAPLLNTNRNLPVQPRNSPNRKRGEHMA